MDKFKLACIEFFNNLKNYILKKDENSKIKYKNLAIVIAVLLALIISLILALSSEDKEDNSLASNQNQTTEIRFDDSQVNTTTQESADDSQLQIATPTAPSTNNTNETDLVTAPSAQEQVPESFNSDEIVDSPKTNSGIFLYCDKFKNFDKANSIKANVAMSLGLMSDVVKKEGLYQLQLGPFASRKEAINTFNKLDSLALVNQCTLETRNN